MDPSFGLGLMGKAAGGTGLGRNKRSQDLASLELGGGLKGHPCGVGHVIGGMRLELGRQER